MTARSRRATLLALLYVAGSAALPLVHNLWHERPHTHGAGEVHRHETRAPTPLPLPAPAHGHRRTLAHARPAPVPAPAPTPPASDPRHGEHAPEHFAFALGAPEAPPPAPVLALAATTPPAADTTVFRVSFFTTPAQPRAPPPAPLV